MLSVEVNTTVVVGNHTLTAQEEAEHVPPRPPFTDPAGTPVDPDTVRIVLQAATGQLRSFSWPVLQTGDTGLVTREEVGRFYVAWVPAPGEDGLWRWLLEATMAFGTKRSTQEVFFVEFPAVQAA